MAQPHAVEVLLRPAVELHTVAVCTGAAILCLVAPWSLALNPLLGLGSALAFLTFGAIRLRDAWAILRYRRNIRRLPRYLVTRSEEHTSELQSLMRISYAGFCLTKKTNKHNNKT